MSDLPSADQFFGGPKPLPTADDFFGPKPVPLPAPTPHDFGAIDDEYLQHSNLGPVLDRFGQGAKDGFGTQPIGLDPQTTADLRKYGVFNDYENGRTSLWRSFNEGLIRPAAAAIDTAMRAVSAGVRGISEVALMTGLPPDLTPEAMWEAFPVGHFTGFPTRIVPPVIERAADLGVIGKGDLGWRGLPQAVEALTPSAEGGVARPVSPEPFGPPMPGPRAPDFHAIAREIAPDTFREYDPLAQQRDTLRGLLTDLTEQRAQGTSPELTALDRNIDQLRAERLEAAPGDRVELANRITALEERRAGLVDVLQREGDTPEMARVRQDLQTVDYRMRDLAPDVAAAYRRAAAGETPTTAAPELPPVPEGHVRMFSSAGTEADGSRWATPSYDYARNYHGGGSAVDYVDVPIDHPSLVDATGASPAEHAANDTKPQFTNSKLSADIAANFKPAIARAETPTETAPFTPPVAEPVPAPPEPTAPPLPGGIAGDVSRQLVAAGRPAEEADAAGALVAAHYETRAARFGGQRGTAEDLYRADAAEVRAGRGVTPETALAQGELGQPRVPSGPLGSDPGERALTALDILSPETPARPLRSGTVRRIAAELEKRGQEALRKLGVRGGVIDGPNPRTDEILSRAIATEIKAALQREGHAADWYTGKIEEAMRVASAIYPELATDPHARLAFTAAMAITSQGEKVSSNIRLTALAYERFRETGRFPTDLAVKKSEFINGNFQKFNDLLDAHSPPANLGSAQLRELLLNTDFTVRELEDRTGYTISGENKDTLVRGSAIFGPKIGQGFFQNLNGNFNPVTMDLWFMRAWGRLTGKLTGASGETLAAQRTRLVDAMTEEGMQIPGTRQALERRAREIVSEHERDYREHRVEYDEKTRTKSELTLAAERFVNGLRGIIETPTSGAHRDWIRARVNRARELLAAEGVQVTNADLQALWWYPEKALYEKMGGRDAEAINVDYASALRDLARQKGLSDDAIPAAVGPLERRPGSAGAADVEGATGAAGEGARGVVGGEAGAAVAEPGAAAGAPAAAAAGAEPTAAAGGELRGGGEGGRASLEEAQRSAAQAAAGQPKLEGLPDKPITFSDGSLYVPGPIARVKDAALKYMRAAGLRYDPPRTYVTVNPERAGRIAQAFEEMEHNPDDPRVKASYEAMVKETLAQWQAIKATGLKVEWIKEGQVDPYAENPRLAAQDVRDNNHWWGFPTDLGYGTEDVTSRGNNPMLQLTDEVVDGRRLLVNDIFRIVHDYFGHFKEGVGFRASGEENAWRAHAAMYSEQARGAMTSETRGQNSWVNYGPHGETNRTASAADTVYSPQKVGLLPDWAMEEGRTDAGGELEQARRGKIRLADAKRQTRAVITLFRSADPSTFIHETGHAWLEELMDDATHELAPAELRADAMTVRKWLGVAEGEQIPTLAHEQFAQGFERYMMEGHAPSVELAGVFAKFRDWLLKIYETVARLRSPINDDIRAVFDRMLVTKDEPPVIAPERIPPETFADVHAADATHTPPHQAAGAADIARTERDNVIEAAHPEIQNERLAAISAEDAGGGPAGRGLPRPGGAAGGADTVPAGGVPGGGAVGAGRGGAAPEGARAPAGGQRAVSEPNAPLPPPDERLVDKAGNIRLDNLNAPADVEQAIRDAADRNADFIGERRGVITDGQLLDLADALGKDPSFLDEKKIGAAFNGEEALAARQLLVQQAAVVREAMARAAEGSEADLVALAQQIARHEMIQGKVAQATAEWGRAGRAFRALEGWEEARDLNQLLKENTGRDLNQLRQMAQLGSRLTTPAQISKLVADTAGGKVRQAIIYYWTNTLISGPITHFTYSVGNAINAIWTPLIETPLAATSGAVRAALGMKDADRVYFHEVTAQIYGLGKGFRDGIAAAVEAYKSGVSPPLPGERIPAQFLTPTEPPIPGIVGQAIGIPGKSVSAIHSFFKSIRYEQNIAALAVRDALSRGLEGDARDLETARLTMSPTEAMMENAVGDSLKELYMGRQPYSSPGALLARTTNAWLPAKILAPFVKIGSNIVRNAFVERTPLGMLGPGEVQSNLLMREGGARFDQQIGKVMAGTGLMAATMIGVLEGSVTGDGPADPNERRIWLLSNKPNSITAGPLTFSYARLGHLSMLVRFAANMTETSQRWNEEEGTKLAHAFFEGITRSVLDETWMRGVKDFFDAIYHADEHFDTWVTRFVAQWTPFSIGLGQVARTIDPYQRETRDLSTAQEILNQIKVHTPLWSQTLPPRRDSFGEPITTGSGTVDRYANDPVVRAMNELHIGLAQPKRTIRGVPLTPQQYDDYARIAGRMAKMELDAVIGASGPAFGMMPPESRIKLIKDIVSHAREGVETQIMMQSLGGENDILKKANDSKEAALRGASPFEVKEKLKAR